jgi:hypothetical protein
VVDHLYTEVKGTIGYLGGERGTVVLIDYAQGFRRGAFVRLDERPAMLYAELGRSTGERGQWSEVVAVREVDRDEFDRLTGLEDVRRSMGWTFEGVSSVG